MTGPLEPPFDRTELKRAVTRWSTDCGKRLATIRNERGLTRDQLAQLAGIAPATLSRIETGTITPRDDLRWILAELVAQPVGAIWPEPTRETIALHKRTAA